MPTSASRSWKPRLIFGSLGAGDPSLVSQLAGDLSTFLHLLRVFFTGWLQAGPDRMNWLIGVDLLVVGAGGELHRLPAALGPAGLLGDHGQHQPACLHSGSWAVRSAASCWPARRWGRAALEQFLCPARGRHPPEPGRWLMSYHFWKVRKNGGISQPVDNPPERSTKSPPCQTW